MARIFSRAVAAHVEHRAHVQRADRGVRVPGAARAVLLEHVRQAVGVLGEMLERHRAVLDEGHRLAVALHRHHDVEAGLAHLPDVLLLLRVGDLDHAAGQAEVGHQLHQVLQLACGAMLVAGELDQQDRVGLALDERVRPSSRNAAMSRARSIIVRSTSSTADGPELDDVLRQLHRGVELREVAHAERALRRQRRELQMEALGPGERAFGADQQVRGVGVRRAEVVEVVAGDLAQHLREARFDLRLFALVEAFQPATETLIVRAAARRRPSARSASARPRPVTASIASTLCTMLP